MIIQHRANVASGEVMISLEYSLAHKQGTLRKKTPKPTIVVLGGLNSGKPIAVKWEIKLPCGQAPHKQDEDADGENWACAALTGPAGMAFAVISTANPINTSTEGFPESTHKNVEFLKLAKILKG
ncbi:hypothetical protein BDV27DRAFT_152698 [Aspergillus caelatus]|uniref:Uncharacterized protein n=1 Tax=Aspergillus caelatus TaxID=61420 RepID=A0A5N7AIW9_9EURO|nr:uncharacterized protein BDV27DRAFT_152698 [Aspergillus caelatus]KAE8369817.1 hypothetical protein BDV27DRAFT_152698 [Aspergillus caelatus]